MFENEEYMKLKDIMKPWNGEKIKTEGIFESADLFSLFLEPKELENEKLDVINEEGYKTGEIKSSILSYFQGLNIVDLLSNTLEVLESGIVAIDKDARIFFLNEMYSKVLGVPVGKVIGRDMRKIEPDADILKALDSQTSIVLERKYIKTIDKYVSGRIFPIIIQNEFKGVVSIFGDATELVQLSREVERSNQIVDHLRNQLDLNNQIYNKEIIGKNPDFLNMLYQASIVAKTDAPVMIRGENGVGKEVIAKFIHRNSNRADKPLITVNCAAIPENLIESELFGYEEGAFTGAKHGGRIGKFEMANGGTLFLDEIGDMPITMQTKLLRALQEKEIEKIGRQNSIAVDVRIITATNQPLENMMEEKTFRRDLYYRINIVVLNVKPLRERKEDLGLLADHFLKKYNEEYKKEVVFSSEVLAFFLSYSWPGNIRELQNCVEYGVIMCQNNIFDKSLLNFNMNLNDKKSTTESQAGNNIINFNGCTLKEASDIAERIAIQDALEKCNYNKTETMELLDVSRRTFYRKMKELNIKL